MRLRLPVALFALLCMAGLSPAEIPDETTTYTPQAPIKMTNSDPIIVTENFSWSNLTGTAIDGMINNFKGHKLTLTGATGNEHVLFDNNKLSVQSESILFTHLASLVIKNHQNPAINIPRNGLISFHTIGLEISGVRYVDISSNNSSANSTAVITSSNSASFHDIDTLKINDNTGSYNGAAVTVRGDLFIYNVKFLQANNNTLKGGSLSESGGVFGVRNSSNSSSMHFFNIDKAEFIGNQVFSSGWTQQIGGGAIVTRCELSFMNNGDIVFHDNSVTEGQHPGGRPQYGANGGAIRVVNNVYFDPSNDTDTDTHRVDFSADRGKIEFRGNRVIGAASYDYTDPNDPSKNTVWAQDRVRLNSVAAQCHTFNVRAQAGREVIFYDPIDVTIRSAHGLGFPEDPSKLGVFFNAPELDQDIINNVYGGTAPEFMGTVRFSGKYTEELIIQEAGETDNEFNRRLFRSRYSQLQANTHLLNGDLIVEERAVLGLIMEGFSYADYAPVDLTKPIVFNSSITKYAQNFSAGRLTLVTEGVLMGPQVKFGKDLIFRTDGTGHIISDNVDYSKGVSYDFDFSLKNAAAVAQYTGNFNADGYEVISNSGVQVYGNKITLGGDLTVADHSRTYADSSWKGNKQFLVLSDMMGGKTEGEFESILSKLTGTNTIGSPYTYKGTWSLVKDGDGLFARWTYDGGEIEEVDPELMGSLTENSLWVTAGNLKALSRVSFHQMATRQMERNQLGSKTCNNFWATSLGDFTNQGNRGSIEGFDYNGGGYAVGYDSRMCPSDFMVGMSFGQLAGTNKTRRYKGSVDQNTLMGQIYGGYSTALTDKLSYNLQLAGTFGRSHNKMKSYFSGGASTFADWNNDAWSLEAVSTWNFQANQEWTLSPFIGLEYTDASHSGLQEWGNHDYARIFSGASMSYLRIPIGITASHLHKIDEQRFWSNSFTLSYLPDVYRNDPKGSATSFINDFRWDVRSASPERHAVRAEVQSYYKINATWGVYAGYSLEAREKSTYQQTNLGVNATF